METNYTTVVKSAKRIAREAKIVKQQANERTKEERQEEVDKIYVQLQELGIPNIMLGKFPDITNDFIITGISASGVIKILDIERELVYLLSNNKKHQCASMLKAL
jgi:translation initiation factor IF-2